MIDRLIRRLPEQIVTAASFPDFRQPRGRQHLYTRLWGFFNEGITWPVRRPLTILGIATGVVLGKDSFVSATIGGFVGGVMGEMLERATRDNPQN